MGGVFLNSFSMREECQKEQESPSTYVLKTGAVS